MPPTNVTRTQRNKKEETTIVRHSIGEADESTRNSHTLSHHVAGLTDACTAKETDSSPAQVKAACS